MLLENKVAVIYGAGGAIGGAVARTFAREGARVFLAGRTQSKLDTVADDIRSQGGLATTMRTQFLTTRAAARYMIERRSGVILTFGGNGNHTLPGLGGFKIALDALEGLRRQWACELGQHGIRVVTLKTGGIPESLPAPFPGREEIVASIHNATLLKRAATLADVGNVAAFIASDLARTITATEVNISCGALMD